MGSSETACPWAMLFMWCSWAVAVEAAPSSSSSSSIAANPGLRLVKRVSIVPKVAAGGVTRADGERMAALVRRAFHSLDEEAIAIAGGHRRMQVAIHASPLPLTSTGLASFRFRTLCPEHQISPTTHHPGAASPWQSAVQSTRCPIRRRSR